MRPRRNFLPAIWLLSIFFPVFSLASDFSIKEKNGIPYLLENGIPYFGWFSKSTREEFDLAGEWRFLSDPKDQGEAERYFQPGYDDSPWQIVQVPSDWTKLRPDLAHYQGVCWYRKTIKTPKEWRTRFNRLELDGVQHKCRIWINGKFVGEHRGGFSQFSFDVSKFLNYGEENQITIQVDNRRGLYDVPPLLSEGDRLGWWESGGICRKVKLVSSLRQTLAKVEVVAEPLPENLARISVRGLVYNAGEEASGVLIEAELVDDSKDSVLVKKSLGPILVNSKEVESFNFSAELLGIKLWSPGSPRLYPLKIRVVSPFGIEENLVEVGFRKFEVKGNKLFLNGKPYYLRGLNRHEDDPETGFYQSDERMRKDLDLLKELGVNHLRPAHYPNDPRWLSLCDLEGITLTEEIPLYQAGTGWTKAIETMVDPGKETKGTHIPIWTSLHQMKNPELRKNAQLQLAEMIERDRNHPSIIIWSIGNENLTIAFSGMRKTYQELYDLCKKLDPSRPVTFALLTTPGLSPALERTAEIADIISVNEYYGWYFGKISGAGPYFDQLHKKYPNKPIIISEFGADTVLGRHNPSAQERYSEEYQARLVMETWEQILARDFISGGMPWAFADFRCGWWGAGHQVPYMNLKGLLSYEREKKLAFFKIQGLYNRLAKER